MNLPKEVSDAVLKVMQEVGYIQKTGDNKFHGYKYASIEGVLEKVQPALVKCGLAIVQSEVSHDVIGDGNLMEAVYEFTLCAGGICSTPVRHTGLASLRNTKGGYDDKALNKCHTAARKYFILGVFQIPTGLEADADAEEDKPKNAPRRDNPAPEPDAYEADLARMKTWAEKAIQAINSFSSKERLDIWIHANNERLDKLQHGHADGFKEVTKALLVRRSALEMKDAAE